VSDLAEGSGQQAGHAALLHKTANEFVAGALGFVNADSMGMSPCWSARQSPGSAFCVSG
jgi:hypothetical protein